MKRVIACIDSSPCINALAEAAAWIAKQTQRELVLLQVLDYYPASYHLGEISGVIGFESNAMLLKELAELEQKQSDIALEYSNNLLRHISEMVQQKYNIVPTQIQEKGDFLEQSFNVLQEDDIAVIGRVGERSAERNKALGSNVENFIRGANCAVMAVDELKDYIENGNITNSVNMPAVSVPRSGKTRITIIHKNVPNVISRITAIVAEENINIDNMVNKSRGEYAYTMLDTDTEVSNDAITAISSQDFAIRVRVIK